MTRRGSFHILRSMNRKGSCPDLSMTLPRMKTSNQPSRNLNLMVMNPRAPKIRHLNASHPLLIELEENVKKVQVTRDYSYPLDFSMSELIWKYPDSFDVFRNWNTKSWS